MCPAEWGSSSYALQAGAAIRKDPGKRLEGKEASPLESWWLLWCCRVRWGDVGGGRKQLFPAKVTVKSLPGVAGGREGLPAEPLSVEVHGKKIAALAGKKEEARSLPPPKSPPHPFL